ncbi:Structural maintenance of chromosomes protein 6 like protein [Argiope bruennichi]|uniref:Structural maintenance of chromosomes protein 6 like protein n=1 Tax=Argiope bruennichi TaxID=94029 RepID=A0A8T0FUW7_ARGBR|nr:Structural maintenance of chromosomes protein 6 like protein [Argiope bruennichi]
MKRLPENNATDRKKRKCLKNAECENSSLVPYKEGELGIVESVTVQNFMCHENVTLNFQPHMNFIIGRNGSGKSAILTAVMLALGGKSSSTDRFTSIKGFIKRGKFKSKVEVVLRNRGELAYKPDVYGEKITVSREFTKDGGSNYKIKSESGTICSNSKSELTNILEAMDIMIDCPLCILTQATSKRFLISKDAKAERLFEFFYKSTGLELLEDRYKKTQTIQADAKAELDKKKQTLPDLKKDLSKWKKFLDSSKRISEYKNELIWAGVIEMEKQLQEKEEELKKVEEEFEEHQRTLEGCRKSLAEKKSELDELIKRKSALTTEMENYRKKLEELKSEYENHSSSYRRNRGTLLKLKNDKKKLEDDILGLKQCIEEQKRKDERNLEEEDRRRQEAIQNLKAENVNLDDKLKTLRETINTKQNEQSNSGKVEENLRAEMNHNLYQLKNIEDNLAASRNAIRNKVNTFGEHTEKVLREIEKNRNKFRNVVIGPIGVYMEVKDPRWAAAVEFAVNSSLLNSFCVDNHQDSQVLRDILRKFYSKPPSIIISQYESQMFDVQYGRALSNFPTVLDMLTINNHLVANCLIDQAQIERKILVENENDGIDLMKNPPVNCQSAYFMNCDQICFNPSRIYSFGKRTPRSRLSAIRVEDIKNMERDKEEKLNRINQIRKQIETMRKAVVSLPEKIEHLEGEVVKLSTAYKKNLMEIKELERKEETKTVDCLQEDLQILQQSYDQKIEEMKRFSQVVSELESKKRDLEGQIQTISASLKSLNDEDYQKLLTKMSQVSKLKENFESGKRSYELQLRCKENKCIMQRKDVEESQKKLEIAHSRAESVCSRINTDRSYEEISRLITETEKVVEAQSNCDRESLSRKYKEKLENLHRAEMELKKIEKYLAHIEQMVKFRYETLDHIRKNTELIIGLAFVSILHGNGYQGHLIFDHASRTLVMNVSPRTGENIRKNHSSLSGGERSFVTIAFLLALWERTRMPFAILDEYDVFMDSSNRQLSVDLLCRKAVEMSQMQFIFLSPLDLPRMSSSECIHILKMAPPKRKAEDEENSPRKKRS